ncbi:MAG: hypothetical protein H0T85_06175 [Geodermatophilaceae bacterium]|nr:hypothetical protein [Geodermatophilaceae bacterium]
MAGALAVLVLLTGCVDQETAANRASGSAITTAEAQVLADVLYRNLEKGGATVDVSAPISEGALLTMTGTVDFATETGTVETTTTYAAGDQPDESRVLYFSRDRLLVGGIPGLTDAMAAAGRDGVQYLRTDLTPAGRFVDNIASMLLNLRAEAADDPDNLIASGTTWLGTIRIDNVLTNTFRTGTATVSVGIQDKLLHQYVATPGNSDFEVTMTLTGHGTQEVGFPPEEQIADASAYPEVAAQFGY